MTTLDQAVVASEPVPALSHVLNDINVRLIGKNKFLPALTELMCLTKDHVTSANLWLVIGVVYARMSYWTAAIGALETAIALDERVQGAHPLLALAVFSIGRREQACQMVDEACKRSKENNAWMLRAYIHAHSSRSSEVALKVAQDWGRRFADPLTRKAKPLVVRDRSPRKKLKIGYVTADFREHSVAFFMEPVLKFHNHEEYEIHVYSNGPWDHFTPKLRMHVQHWDDVMELSDKELTQKIRDDGIDVLVDLSGYTQGHRLGVFAQRAAPVQATWVGYIQPLGMKAMDYRLVAPGLVPPSLAPYFSEALFQLQASACYEPPAYAPLCEVPPMVRNGYPTLVSPNSSAKITDQMLRLWARILHERTDARLIIMVKEGDADAAQADMQPRVEAAGFPLDRVSVMHQQPLNHFMEVGHIADIMLDTAPISGGTTTLHSLWMGMPVVTLDAERAVDASSAYLLRELGLETEIAQTEEEYLQIAMRLMADPERLCVQRENIRAHMRSSIFMDYAAYAADVEKSFRIMWLNWLRGDKRDLSLDVDVEAEMALSEGRAP
ncbi:glycosyltransferase [Comamonas sp. UBA7528]|uniref:O-linked N-acetylglucosamine transferase, SPINDLY family protein n=1 Tax=Comamonas sp. UBA7528 TaxID=1946391 RepID=UPI0025C43171|nr:glycosyltransferase [Comamonas sp. UBA7528]